MGVSQEVKKLKKAAKQKAAAEANALRAAAFKAALAEGRDPAQAVACLLYTSPSPRDLSTSRMPSSA